MEAKDTVMTYGQLRTYCISKGIMYPDENDMSQAQAEIAFKAGMKQGLWLFAWWKDGVQYVGTSGKTLAEAYKELEIE